QIAEHHPLRESSAWLPYQRSREQQAPLPDSGFHALAPYPLQGLGVETLPVGAFLALVTDNSHEQSVVYRPQRPALVLTWGPCHAAVQQCLHRLGREQANLESERCVRPVEELMTISPDACPRCSAPVIDPSGEVAMFVDEAT
ncbi:unnamed protein product, partial [Ectocarpus sp. 13 AM-2016]